MVKRNVIIGIVSILLLATGILYFRHDDSVGSTLDSATQPQENDSAANSHGSGLSPDTSSTTTGGGNNEAARGPYDYGVKPPDPYSNSKGGARTSLIPPSKRVVP